MTSAMNARKLRLLLIVVMLLIVVAATAGFVFAQRYLANYATSISKLNADAQSGDKNLETLSQLETQLASQADLVAQARSLVADNATYTDRFLTDIGQIATRSGVTVTGIEFSDDSSATTSAPAAGTPAATTPNQTAATPQAGAAGGVTKKTVTVSIKSPLEYSTLMTFLQAIETNPLKMQVTNVSLAKGEGNNVTTQDFSVEVYVRQ